MKTLKVFAIVIVITIFMSCSLLNDSEIYIPKVEISSTNMFSIDGKVYSSTSKYIPFEIYNPNMYSIVINIDGNDYTIEKYGTMRFE